MPDEWDFVFLSFNAKRSDDLNVNEGIKFLFSFYFISTSFFFFLPFSSLRNRCCVFFNFAPFHPGERNEKMLVVEWLSVLQRENMALALSVAVI